MKENQILVIIKEPGKQPRLEPLFDNTLEAFQKEVGGYIETVTLVKDCVIVCNEEGRLLGLPYNCDVAGAGFVGTIMAVGVRGEEFASLKAAAVPLLIRTLGG